MNEVGNDFLAARRVRHLWMKLQGEQLARAILEGGMVRVLGDRDRSEAGRQFRELVSMRIPNLQGLRKVGEEGARPVLDPECAFAEFAFEARLDFATQEMPHDLQPIADAQHGNSQLEDCAIRQGSARGVHTRRAAGEDQTFGPERRDFSGGGVVSQDDGIDIALTDASRDNLRVLRAEI